MFVGIVGGRYRRERPIDIFAKDFLIFLKDELSLKGDWMPKVKVLLCNDDTWTRLWDIQNRTIPGNPEEYMPMPDLNRQKWQGANGWVYRLINYDSEGRWIRPSERERLGALMRIGFNRVQAEDLAPFDAVIFLHTSRPIEAGEKGQPVAGIL